MKTQQTTPSNVQSVNDSKTVTEFLTARGIRLSADKDVVKSFFEGEDYHLAIFDAKHGKNTMLLTIKNFVQNEDMLIELNSIFRSETQDISSYHILKFARQATDEVIGLLPTFQAFFGKRTVSTPAVNVSFRNKYVPQSANIAA